MLIEEAMWFRKQLQAVDSTSLSPILNVGSSTEDYRNNFQPWVDKYVFFPLKDRDITVKHQDIKAMPGVDIIGDFTDPQFVKKLSKQSFKSLICANLLEHVENPNQVANTLVEILPSGGYLYLSCPYKFPYHPDPEDYLFRPDVDQLASLFPMTKKIAGDIVVCRTYFAHLYPKWPTLLKMILRLCLPFYKTRRWLVIVKHLPWLFRKLEATCLLLQKL